MGNKPSHTIPSTSVPCSRYAPNPGSYHVANNSSGSGVIGVPKRRKRKRTRKAAFDDDDSNREESLDEEIKPQRRKKMRLNNGHSTNGVNGRRKPFWDNYLRPINSVSSFKAPKYSGKRNDEQKHAQLQQLQKPKVQPIKDKKQIEQ